MICQANLCPKRSQEQESSIFLRINLPKESRGKRWNRISETQNIKIFRGSMPPDSTRLGRLRRYNFPPYLRAKGLLEDTSLWEL